jgi:DNA-binding response OmpR family regulator
MPVMNGIQLCREVKRDPDLHGIRVVLLTALSTPADLLSALEVGADFHIPKPYRSDYLAAKIAEIISRGDDGGRAQPVTAETLTFDGKSYQIAATLEHVLRLLLSTYEVALQQNEELLAAKAELLQLNTALEEKVQDRTSNLMAEIANRKVVEDREMLAREVLDMLNRPEKAEDTIRRHPAAGEEKNQDRGRGHPPA